MSAWAAPSPDSAIDFPSSATLTEEQRQTRLDPEKMRPTGRIESVVVYPDRAAITRVVEVDVLPGVNSVAFLDLPPALDERTLQAEGSGVEGAKLLGLDVVSRELAEDRRRRVSELEQLIQEVRDQIRADNDLEAAANVELGFLKALQTSAAAQISKELMFAPDTPAHARDLSELLEKRVPEVLDRIRMAQIAARDKGARLSALERELETVRGAAQWARRDVQVQIESPAAGKVRVQLTYVLPGASWSPAYDVRGRPDADRADLTMNALVVQTSGEDWSGVKLTLSTARPSGGVTPPILSPYWMERAAVYSYDEYPAAGGGRYDAEKEDAGFAKQADAPAEPMAVVSAVVHEQVVASSFEIVGETTIVGDGTRRKVRVTDVELAAEYRDVAVPRIEEAAFLVAHSKWEQGWPLLPGEVSVFLGDSFIGSSHIPLAGRGSELELGFGRDEAVQIKREIVQDMTSRPNWLGAITTTREWKFTVTNGRKAPMLVEIRDRIPQTAMARVKVKAIGDPPTEIEPEGLVSFELDMEPAREVSRLFGYTVQYSKKHSPGVIE